ncbi:PP2C family protein-serine/threonine phosphatase [Actinomadura sp. WMMB 499]|uniref:PP2C family protein-serine/threonine phosphatase n=1 Tax=Actinomadura sp. WMMB 499 TaxID=1219491 RepID=UPI0012493427|nr:PP2C family protein-serine/threonine phosphatase [Actinomadura sp. WMMB 499]QFG23512.1 serine/threonine-protein phosphatase [Actinomadura sp. WMMB 499]
MSDGFGEVVRAVQEARPHELAAVAGRAVGRYTGGGEARLLLPDYRQTVLVAPDGGETPIANTAPGHAFAAQRTIRDETDDTLHVPLTVHGDRIGVLTVPLPPGAEPDRLDELAAVLARAVRLADGGTDLYRRVRRRTRLTVAAEMQWDLLPASAFETAEIGFAGRLEPAYAVWGDHFDWAAATGGFTLAVTNGMGTGTEAAGLTHLAVSALRNARRSGGDIAEQATLADQAVFARHRGALYVSTLLLDFDHATGRVRTIDAGSPRIYRLRGTSADLVEFDAQLPLGMFGDTRYVVEEFTVEPGDRLVVVSDGVHGARSPSSAEPFGGTRLLNALRDTRLQAPPEAVGTVVRNYVAFYEGEEPADDAVVVCVDWRGVSGGA